MLELTARLTLSSCVSQLTDFYDTTIVHEIAEKGLQDIRINLCSPEGEVYPYFLSFKVFRDYDLFWQLGSLVAQVIKFVPNPEDLADELCQFSCSISVIKNSTRDTFKCALHVCGDFIKFDTRKD